MRTIHGLQVTAISTTQLSDDSATGRAQPQQREETRTALRNKYHTMLDLAELMVTFPLSATGDQAWEKTKGELQYLIDQTRKGLRATESSDEVFTA